LTIGFSQKNNGPAKFLLLMKWAVGLLFKLGCWPATLTRQLAFYLNWASDRWMKIGCWPAI
jgi:hypothetical protein